jgi:hypothetical protein
MCGVCVCCVDRLMHAVGPREFLNQGWQKNADLNLAPNITAIIDRFNQVSYWTTTEVLTKDTPQLMAKTIKRYSPKLLRSWSYTWQF